MGEQKPPPARIYQLPFRCTTKKGAYYLGVRCSGCSEPLLRIPAKHKDDRWPDHVVIDGKLRIPCHVCETDGLYEKDDLQAFEAQEDFTSVTDLRIAPSGSGRRPFLRKKSTMRTPTLGVGAIERRPIAAALVARCVSHWTAVETASARLLAMLMRADNEPAIALYLSLKNARAKAEALEAVAHSQLDPKDLELLQALLKYKDQVERQRNDIAHGVFGVSESYKDGLLWVSTTDFAIYSAKTSANGVTEELAQWLHERLFVYEPADLETLAREIENLEVQLGYFMGYLGSTNAHWRASRYRELCNERGTREALARLKKERRK